MKIVFLNIWGSHMTEGLVPYIKEQALNTDVFCLQEATPNAKEACARVLNGYVEISDYKFIDHNDNFPQTMFIRNDIELLSSGTLFGDDMTIGLAMYAELKIGDKNMYVCNVHGRSRPSDKLDNPDRLKFSQKIIEFFQDKNTPVVIGGDFNIEPTTESLRMFENHSYRDLIKEHNIPTTRNHLAWDRYPDNKMYFSDYVFLNDKVTLNNFDVDNNEISDHLPMVLTITT